MGRTVSTDEGIAGSGLDAVKGGVVTDSPESRLEYCPECVRA